MVKYKLVIERMLEKHIDRVHKIEEMVNTHPWNKISFYDCLKFKYYALVLRHGKKIIGFIILDTSIDEVHVLNFAVNPQEQHKGFGQMMLIYVLKEIKALGTKCIYLEVRKSNMLAQYLYKKFGFKQIGVRKDYYPKLPDQREDAVVLRLVYREKHETSL